MTEDSPMEKCRWCDKTGSWPAICKSTRDMEDKPHDPVCDAMLLRLGGGERIVNQERARHAYPNGQ